MAAGAETVIYSVTEMLTMEHVNQGPLGELEKMLVYSIPYSQI